MSRSHGTFFSVRSRPPRQTGVLVSAMFIGMSCGAFLANRIFASFGFAGVCVMGAVAAGAALGLRG